MKKTRKTLRKSAIKLDPRKLGVKIQSVHEIVQSRMTQKRWTPYRLAKAAAAAGGTMSEQSLRNFLKGANMRSNHLSVVLAVLDLEIRLKK